MSDCANGTPEEGNMSISLCVSPAAILSLSTHIHSLVPVFVKASQSQAYHKRLGAILASFLKLICHFAFAEICNTANNCTLLHERIVCIVEHLHENP